MTHYLETASNELVKYFKQTGVQGLVIGWSEGFKENIRIGKVNTQSFVSIPHARFRDLLKRKCYNMFIEIS